MLGIYPKLEAICSTLFLKIYVVLFFLKFFALIRRPWDFFQHRAREIGVGLNNTFMYK